MPRILVVDGTTDGHTAKVAGAMAEALHRTGSIVDVMAADDRAPAPDGYDAVARCRIPATAGCARGHERIVAKTGDTDTRKDYEYTDWDDLRQFAADFGLRLSEATTRAAVH